MTVSIFGYEFSIRRADAGGDANTGMLDQFYGTMQVTLKTIEIDNQAPEFLKLLYADAVRILNGPPEKAGEKDKDAGKDQEKDEKKEARKRSWNEAYRAEKLLARIRPAASLPYELDAQITYLNSLAPKIANSYREQFKALYPNWPERTDELEDAAAQAEDAATQTEDKAAQREDAETQAEDTAAQPEDPETQPEDAATQPEDAAKP